MSNFFERYFHLRDHPFAPDDGRFVSPDMALNLFRGDPSTHDYFVRLSAFSQAITNIEEFLRTYERTFRSGKPPALLVLGPSGSGRTTLAGYAAYRVRSACHEMTLADPGFTDIEVPSEDYARLLDEVRVPILTHLSAHHVDWKTTAEAVGPLTSDEPNQAQLERLFKNLGRNAPQDLPINVLAIGPITSRRERFMLDLRVLLAPLRVFPIFLTDDPTVAAIFDATNDQSPRLSVQVGQLVPDDAIQLLSERFDVLRSPDRQQAGVQTLFPYSDSLVRRLFLGEEKTGIKYFIAVCSVAFDRRVGCLRDHERSPTEPAPASELCWDDFESAIRYYR